MRLKHLLLLFCLIALMPACQKDFGDINDNPYNPTTTSDEAIFNGVMSSLILGWNEQFYIHNEIYYDLTQQAALIAHSWFNRQIGIDEMWGGYYSTLRNIRELERRFEAYPGDQAELVNVKAMLKIITAYKTFRMTDQFGDIPFFDAGKGVESQAYLRPGYDSQELIYKALLVDLKWAADNINTNANATTAAGKPLRTFGVFDPLYGSNMMKWRKFANALRLRHAMRMVEKDPAFATPVIKEILESKSPLPETGEDIVLVPRQMGWGKASTNWSFREHKNVRMGSVMWHLLSPQDNADGSGIIDPRAEVWFEPNNGGDWAAYPNVPGANPPEEGGIPYGTHRDQQPTVKGANCMFSPVNYYLTRDESDIPEILLTAAEMHLLKAEAWLRGLGVTHNDDKAFDEYNQGILASVKFWRNAANASHIWPNPPAPMTDAEIFPYINRPEVFFLQPGNDQLELIYRQLWLDAFRQPWEAFALMRRTGRTPHEGAFPAYYRLPYPAAEADYNTDNWQEQVIRMGGYDDEKVKVWWMK